VAAILFRILSLYLWTAGDQPWSGGQRHHRDTNRWGRWEGKGQLSSKNDLYRM